MTCGKERVSEGAKVDANVEGQMEGRCAEVKVDEKVEGQTEGRCEEEKADAKVEGQIGGGSVEARVSEKQESKKEEGGKEKKKPKRKSWWCPIVGCTSGPVQKIGQHFDTVHHLSVRSRANRTLRKYKIAPTKEAIRLGTRNPYARHTLGSSRSLDQYSAPGPSRALPHHVTLDTLVSCFSSTGKSTKSVGGSGKGGFKSGGRKKTLYVI